MMWTRYKLSTVLEYAPGEEITRQQIENAFSAEPHHRFDFMSAGGVTGIFMQSMPMGVYYYSDLPDELAEEGAERIVSDSLDGTLSAISHTAFDLATEVVLPTVQETGEVVMAAGEAVADVVKPLSKAIENTGKVLLPLAALIVVGLGLWVYRH